MDTIYKEYDLLKKITAILEQREIDELLCAHEIANEIEKHYPKTFDAIGKPLGGSKNTQDTLTRYIARLLYPPTIPEVKECFTAFMFGKTGVAKIDFKDGTSQEMHPSYGVVLFGLKKRNP